MSFFLVVACGKVGEEIISGHLRFKEVKADTRENLRDKYRL